MEKRKCLALSEKQFLMYTFFVFLILLAGMHVLATLSGFEDVWNRTHWAAAVPFSHRLNIWRKISKVYLGSCAQLYSWAETPHPPPRIWAHIRRRYWSAKIDDISLWPPAISYRCPSYPIERPFSLIQYMTLHVASVIPFKFPFFNSVHIFHALNYLWETFFFQCKISNFFFLWLLLLNLILSEPLSLPKSA